MTALNIIPLHGAAAPLTGLVRERPGVEQRQPPSVRAEADPHDARGEPSARGRDPLPAGAGTIAFPPWMPAAAFLALQIAQLGAEAEAVGWWSPSDARGAVSMPALERGLAAYRIGLGRTVSYSGPVSPIDLLI